MKKIWTALFLSFALAGALIFMGCGSSTETTTTTSSTTTTTLPHGSTSYFGTQSPGDWWSWALTDTTFIGTNETAGYYYSGTYTTLPTGFRKATITSTSDPGLTTPADAYILEYPNVAMLVKPAGSDDNVIVCAAKATTSPGAGRYNYINMPYQDWEVETYAAYGTTEVVLGGDGKYDFSNIAHELITGEVVYTSQEVDFVLADGKISKAGSDLQVFLTPSGAFMGDSGPSQGGFAGAKMESISVTDIVTREYNGIMFEYDTDTGAGTSTPVGGEPHPTVSNAIRGFAYADLETGSEAPNSEATLSITGPDSDGIFSGTMTTHEHTYTMRAVVARVAGKVLFFGIAKAPDNESPMNFLVIEK